MKRYRALVTRVYDGDTITADIELGFGVLLTKQKLRLNSVKAPEIRGKNRATGLISRDALREKIDGKYVLLETDGFSKGKYGRWLVDVYFDDLFINEWLINSSLAERYE